MNTYKTTLPPSGAFCSTFNPRASVRQVYIRTSCELLVHRHFSALSCTFPYAAPAFSDSGHPFYSRSRTCTSGLTISSFLKVRSIIPAHWTNSEPQFLKSRHKTAILRASNSSSSLGHRSITHWSIFLYTLVFNCVYVLSASNHSTRLLTLRTQ